MPQKWQRLVSQAHVCLHPEIAAAYVLIFIKVEPIMLISDTVSTSVWVLCVCGVGVCHPDEGAEHMPGAAAGERRGNI